MHALGCWRLAFLIGLSSLSSCDQEPTAASGTRQGQQHGTGKGSDTPSAEPSDSSRRPAPNDPTPVGARSLDRAAIADEQLLQAILDECHRPLQRRMQQVKVSVTLPDARRIQVQADLPDRARVFWGTRDYLWTDQQLSRLDAGKANATAIEREANRALIPALVRIADAIAFGPLYRASKCQRRGEDFVLTEPSGATTTLQLHEQTLLPKALIYGDETVRFDGYLRTKTSWVVNRVSTAALGTCDAIFDDGGVLFPADFFQQPNQPAESATPGAPPLSMTAPGTVRERESATPILETGKAMQWVVLAAGDDWTRRHELYTPVHQELEAQNQQIFGFPMLWQEDDQQLLGVPFRTREDGKEFAAPEGWQIRNSPETKLLVVYPPNGTVAERIRDGSAQLLRAATNRSLQTIGPIVAQPFIHLHRGVPDSAKLKNCKVRVSVRIQ